LHDPTFRIRRIEPIFASSGKHRFVPLRQHWKTAQTAIVRAEIMMASPAKARNKCFAAIMVMRDNAGGKLYLLLRGQQRCLHDLSEVNLNGRLRIVSHAPTSPQIGSEATVGFDSRSDAPRTLRSARFL
jgi:hypothetical protein